MKARLQRKQTGSRCGETSPLLDELDLARGVLLTLSLPCLPRRYSENDQ